MILMDGQCSGWISAKVNEDVQVSPLSAPALVIDDPISNLQALVRASGAWCWSSCGWGQLEGGSLNNRPNWAIRMRSGCLPLGVEGREPSLTEAPWGLILTEVVGATDSSLLQMLIWCYNCSTDSSSPAGDSVAVDRVLRAQDRDAGPRPGPMMVCGRRNHCNSLCAWGRAGLAWWINVFYNASVACSCFSHCFGASGSNDQPMMLATDAAACSLEPKSVKPTQVLKVRRSYVCAACAHSDSGYSWRPSRHRRAQQGSSPAILNLKGQSTLDGINGLRPLGVPKGPQDSEPQDSSTPSSSSSVDGSSSSGTFPLFGAGVGLHSLAGGGCAPNQPKCFVRSALCELCPVSRDLVSANLCCSLVILAIRVDILDTCDQAASLAALCSRWMSWCSAILSRRHPPAHEKELHPWWTPLVQVKDCALWPLRPSLRTLTLTPFAASRAPRDHAATSSKALRGRFRRWCSWPHFGLLCCSHIRTNFARASFRGVKWSTVVMRTMPFPADLFQDVRPNHQVLLSCKPHPPGCRQWCPMRSELKAEINELQPDLIVECYLNAKYYHYDPIDMLEFFEFNETVENQIETDNIVTVQHTEMDEFNVALTLNDNFQELEKSCPEWQQDTKAIHPKSSIRTPHQRSKLPCLHGRSKVSHRRRKGDRQPGVMHCDLTAFEASGDGHKYCLVATVTIEIHKESKLLPIFVPMPKKDAAFAV